MGHLVKVFPSKKGLVAGVGLQQSWKRLALLTLLPGLTAAVSFYGVVDDVVVVGVFTRQDAGSTWAAQWARNKLG